MNALLSVYKDDRGERFKWIAHELDKRGINLYASGGTAGDLGRCGRTVTDVATIIGGGAILGHRVVTLSREVHAGLLATGGDVEEMEGLGLPYMDIVFCTLYPMTSAIAQPRISMAEVIELTDIGGPCMLRSAAKGRRIIISDIDDAETILEWLDDGVLTDLSSVKGVIYRDCMAAKGERIVANYAKASADFIDSWGRRAAYGEGLFWDGLLRPVK